MVKYNFFRQYINVVIYLFIMLVPIIYTYLCGETNYYRNEKPVSAPFALHVKLIRIFGRISVNRLIAALPFSSCYNLHIRQKTFPQGT